MMMYYRNYEEHSNHTRSSREILIKYSTYSPSSRSQEDKGSTSFHISKKFYLAYSRRIIEALSKAGKKAWSEGKIALPLKYLPNADIIIIEVKKGDSICA